MKLSPDGNILWNDIFERRYGLDATALTYNKGKLFIGGQLLYGVDLDPGIDSAIFYSNWVGLYFASYDTTGKFLWGKSINSSGNLSSIYDIQIDGEGNVCMIGYFNELTDFDPGPGVANLTPSPPYMELYLAKYDSLGDFIWAKDISVETAYGSREGPQLEIDYSNNDIVIGGSFARRVDFDPGPDSLILESTPGAYSGFYGVFNKDGSLKWVKSIYGSSSSVTGLAVDNERNIYITGDAVGTNDFDPGPDRALVTMDPVAGIYFAMYDSLGVYKWTRTTGNWIGGTVTNPTIHYERGFQYLCGYFRREADLDPGPDTSYLRAQNVSGFFGKYSITGAQAQSSCLGQDVVLSLSDTSFVDFFEWSFWDNGQEHKFFNSPAKYTFSSIGLKEIVLTWMRQGETFKDTFMVFVSERPIVNLGNDVYLCESHHPIINAANETTQQAKFLWHNGSSDSLMKLDRAGTYWVSVSVDGCYDSDTIEVFERNSEEVKMPNIITPNGDGHNDEFEPDGDFGDSPLAIEIYNRWGQLIFSDSYYRGNWDASKHSPGVYYYILKVSEDFCEYSQTGFFHIQ